MNRGSIPRKPGAGGQGLGERLAEPVPLLLDGATGTELERRGVHCELPLWSARALVECPEVVGRIHAEYAESGADLLTANTFRTQRRTLARAGLEGRAGELTARAVGLARDAARTPERKIWVLGSAPPLEDCFRPDLVPDEAALAREHAEHAAHLAEAGADGILIETMNTIREARAALVAARDTGLPAFVSFTCADARLLSGERLADALAAVAELAPAAVGVNCLPPSEIAACLPALRNAGIPFLVSPNLGAPETEGGRAEDLAPARFAALVPGWLDAGARIVGGCCGTTPDHIRAVAQLLRETERRPAR